MAAPAASVDDFTSRMAIFDEQVRKQTEQMQLRESDIKQKQQQLAVLCERYEEMLATANKNETSLQFAAAALKKSGNQPILSHGTAGVASAEVKSVCSVTAISCESITALMCKQESERCRATALQNKFDANLLEMQLQFASFKK